MEYLLVKGNDFMNGIKNIEVNKKLLIVLVMLVILFAILKIINYNSNTKYVSYKLDSDQKYVYTKYSSSTNSAKVPYINIVGADASEANDEIVSNVESYLSSKDVNKTVTYRYNQYKNILSVVLTYRDIDSEKRLQYRFKTYVFDLKNDCKLLSDEEILNRFNVTYANVDNEMAKSMKDKYNDELDQGILTKDKCDYNCFLRLRGITHYIDNANYYIEEGHLVVYRSYNVFSVYNEEDYYTRNDFKFIIK